MAHHIAELINDVENSSYEKRPANADRCANAILHLWKHRHQLPNGKRPFEDMEPIMRTIESLDPNDDTPRFFRSQRLEAEESVQSTKTKKWLKIIDGLNYSAKLLIGYSLKQASEKALDKSEKWVKLAEKIDLEDDIDLPVIRFITEKDSQLEANESEDREKKRLEGRIDRLNGFIEMADALKSDMRRQLRKLQSSKK